jgi:signal transduction histidine kinase
VDLIVAGAITVIAQLETWTDEALDPRPVFAAAALAVTLPLVWRRAAPLPVLIGMFVPLYAVAATENRFDGAYIMLALIAAFTAVGSFSPDRRQATLGLAVGLALLGVLFALEAVTAATGDDATPVGDFVFVGGIVSAFWALAIALRERSQHAEALENRAERLEREREERARQAVAEERARIARELHDVVAHSVSVIAVQTGSIRRRLRHERPDEAEELEATERTARQALGELRRMLGLLRADDEDLALAPQPGIDDIGELVERSGGAGVTVALRVEGEARALAPGVDLAAYRIVQEALTNVIRHAGPARAEVAVRFGERELELEVTDNGRGAGAARNGDGGGHGLVGMRERAALYGGSVDAGPEPDGGFAVRARLPIITA